MKYLALPLTLIAALLCMAPTTVTKPTHITITTGSSLPTDVQVLQGGTSCPNNFSAGCVTNTQQLKWTAAAGASSYTTLPSACARSNGRPRACTAANVCQVCSS